MTTKSLKKPGRPLGQGLADAHFETALRAVQVRIDRLFSILLLSQWVAGIIFATTVSARTWDGASSAVHPHVWAAVVGGGMLAIPQVAFALRRPGTFACRQVTAVAQLLSSALLIHLSGGRIETHFHVFGSLAFISLYRDRWALVTATAVAVLEHVVMAAAWPMSMYGVMSHIWGRTAEHAAWVAFIDVFLAWSIGAQRAEMRQSAARRADLERTNAHIESAIAERTNDLTSSEERLRLAVRGTDVGLWDWDLNQNTIFYSARAMELFGFEDCEAVVPPAFRTDRLHPDDVVGVERARTDHLLGRCNYDVEYRFRVASGEYRWFRDRASAVRDVDGRAGRMVGSVTDVDERMQAEVALRASEANYRQLLKLMPVAAYTTDADGLITFFNDEAERLWGRAPAINSPAERFCGSLELFAPDGTPVAHEDCWMGRALRDGRPYHGREIVVGRADGSRRTALSHAHPIFGPDGKLVGGVKVMVDITERQEAEIALRESEAVNRQVIDAALDAVVGMDEQGVVTRWNPAAEGMFGWSAGEAVGRQMHELLVPQADRDACTTGLRAFLETGAGRMLNRHVEAVATRRDGREFPVELSIAPLRGRDGYRFSAFVRDLTDRRAAEAAGRERRTLTEAVEAMRQVLGVVGHELRTPLAGLRAISELLLDPDVTDPTQVHDFLVALNAEVLRMSDTVNNLLEAARLSSGVAQWNWAEYDVDDVCVEAIETIRPLLDPLAVVVSAESSGGATARGDRHAVRRVILNLLSNAQKHTRAGTIVVKPRTFDEGGHRWLEVRVEDSGAGMPPEIIRKLGQAFALNSGVVGAANVRGSGLGLSICKGIAAAHGGAITVRSEPGVGSTFTVRVRADLREAEQLKETPICQEVA